MVETETVVFRKELRPVPRALRDLSDDRIGSQVRDRLLVMRRLVQLRKADPRARAA